MSPSQSSFRLEAIYVPVGFVCKVNMYLRDMLFWFPPNPHFGWWLFLTVGFVWKVIMYLRVKGFSNFVPILISAGGHFDQLDLFTEWSCICSRWLSYFFLIFTWQECRYASKTTNLKQLLLTSKFTFWPQGEADLQETQLLPWQKLVLTAKIASTQQLLWYSTATSNHQICFLEPQSRTWKKRHQRCM